MGCIVANHCDARFFTDSPTHIFPPYPLVRTFIDSILFLFPKVGERPLHGSGPSAYISMFKAQVRQEIEVINRKRERSQKSKTPGESDSKVEHTSNSQKQKRRRKAPGDDPWVAVAPDPRVKAALNKKPRSLDNDNGDSNDDFPAGQPAAARKTEERYLQAIGKGSDDPLENLPALGRNFLEWAGINDPEDFVSTKTADLAIAFTNYRKFAKMSVLNGSGAAAYCGAWKSQVRKQLALQEELGVSRKAANDANESDPGDVPASKKRKHKASAVIDVEVSSPAKKRPL